MPVGLCLRLGVPSGLDRSCSLSRSRRCSSPPPGQELCSPGAPGSRAFPYGRRRDLSGSLATPPAPLPCSETPAEIGRVWPCRRDRCCPRTQHGEGFGAFMISRLPQGFSARCLRFTNAVAAARARLASGWRAPPLPGGRRTLWVALKGFRSHPSEGKIRKKFLQGCLSAREARKRAPRAALVVQADGGYWAFESAYEAARWRSQNKPMTRQDALSGGPPPRRLTPRSDHRLA